MEEKLYKVGDVIPQAGEYVCVVCGVVVEYLPRHIEKGAVFGVCPLCHSGSENGPKKTHEEFWKFVA